MPLDVPAYWPLYLVTCERTILDRKSEKIPRAVLALTLVNDAGPRSAYSSVLGIRASVPDRD